MKGAEGSRGELRGAEGSRGEAQGVQELKIEKIE